MQLPLRPRRDSGHAWLGPRAPSQAFSFDGWQAQQRDTEGPTSADQPSPASPSISATARLTPHPAPYDGDVGNNSEAELEAWFRRRVRLLGGQTIKLAPTEAGVPDRLVIMPRGRLFLVELKTETGEVSKIQQHWHREIMKLGVTVHVLYGIAGVTRWLREVVEGYAPHLAHEPAWASRKDWS